MQISIAYIQKKHIYILQNNKTNYSILKNFFEMFNEMFNEMRRRFTFLNKCNILNLMKILIKKSVYSSF